jgi:acetyl-CoA carboxylase carboxyltransferase component
MGVVPGMATDFVFSWPIAEFGVMGAKETVRLFWGADIAKAENPEQFLAEKVKVYRDQFANPLFVGSMATLYEDIIEPKETRKVLAGALKLLKGKKVTRQPKRHGNIPL